MNRAFTESSYRPRNFPEFQSRICQGLIIRFFGLVLFLMFTGVRVSSWFATKKIHPPINKQTKTKQKEKKTHNRFLSTLKFLLHKFQISSLFTTILLSPINLLLSHQLFCSNLRSTVRFITTVICYIITVNIFIAFASSPAKSVYFFQVYIHDAVTCWRNFTSLVRFCH